MSSGSIVIVIVSVVTGEAETASLQLASLKMLTVFPIVKPETRTLGVGDVPLASVPGANCTALGADGA